jgi:MtrB/PioB family decaheme-associated outer membrane protein
MRQTSTAIALALGCVFVVSAGLGPAAAAADDGSFRLWVEPVSLWVLDKSQDTNSSKFEEYLDLTSGLWASMKIGGESEDGDRTLSLDLNAIGRDHARYTLDYGYSGRYAVTVDYNKIRHLFGNDATLLWNQTARNRFELADPVQAQILDSILEQRAAGGSVNFDFLEPLLAPYYETATSTDLGLQRNRTHIRVDVGKMGKLAWSLEINNENRDGNRPMGASFGFNNAQEIPEPVQYQTTSYELGGELTLSKAGIRFGYRQSEFTNDLGFVIWDNPFRSFDSTNPIAYLGPNTTPEGPSQGQTSLPPDNSAQLLFVQARGKAGSWWYNGSLSYNTMKQNEEILPFTINTAIEGFIARTGQSFNAASGGLPINRADLEVDVTKFAASTGTSLGDAFDLTFRYSSYDYDNTSRRVEFPGWVRLDAVWESPALLTVPYDYTRDRFSAELAWELTDATQLTLAYRLESWDRTFREIESSDEDTFELSLDSRPGDKVALRASWATGDRSTSEYSVEAQEVFFVEPEGINNQPDLRKYDQAERDVDDYDAQVQLFPSDAVNVTLGVSGRDEDYSESVFGLVSEEISTAHFEIGYSPGAALSFYLFGHLGDHDVFQRARQSGGTLSTDPRDDWSALLEEKTATWGAGFNSELDSGVNWELSASVSDVDGSADLETPEGGSPSSAVDIDNYEDIELVRLWFRAEYAMTENVAFGLFVLRETYEIDSFIQAGVVPYLPQSILLAANDGNYEANLFGLNLRLAF